MRKLKFRGKRVDNGEWAYGWYCCVQKKHRIILPGAFVGPGNGIYGYVEVHPETVGQYTGLHDRQGKEAYAPETVGQDISLKYYTIFCKDTGEYEDTRLRFYEDSDPKLEKVKDDKDTNTKTD